MCTHWCVCHGNVWRSTFNLQVHLPAEHSPQLCFIFLRQQVAFGLLHLIQLYQQHWWECPPFFVTASPTANERRAPVSVSLQVEEPGMGAEEPEDCRQWTQHHLVAADIRVAPATALTPPQGDADADLSLIHI